MDKYDEAIARLRKVYEEEGEEVFIDDVVGAWGNCLEDGNGCLFLFCTPDGSDDLENDNEQNCGCLTQVRGQNYQAWTDRLTYEIRRDKRIPFSEEHITHPDQLEVFAEWQRRLDKEIRNVAADT